MAINKIQSNHILQLNVTKLEAWTNHTSLNKQLFFVLPSHVITNQTWNEASVLYAVFPPQYTDSGQCNQLTFSAGSVSGPHVDDTCSSVLFYHTSILPCKDLFIQQALYTSLC